MNAVSYLRVSTREQANEGLSLENQEKGIASFCEAVSGHKIIARFIEGGASAKTTEGRPEFLRMLEYCKEHSKEIDAVIVWKLDRFARKTKDHFRVKTDLAALGIRLYSATEAIDDETPIGRFMETILAGSAQFDNDNRTERVRAGMEGRAEQGRWVWEAPVGYLNHNDGDGPTVVPDPLKAKIIERMFTEFSKGIYKQTEIREMANNLGLRTKSGRTISTQTVNKILRNKLYAGYIQTRMLDHEVKGIHEPLVDLTIFERCQAILGGKTAIANVREPNNPEFPLKGLLRCDSCGNRLTASKPKGKTKRYGYYHCYTCHKPAYIPTGPILEKFEELLTNITPDKKVLNLFSEIIKDVWKSDYKNSLKLKREAQFKLETLKSDKKNLILLYAKRHISEIEYKEVLDPLDSEILTQNIIVNDLEIDCLEINLVLKFATNFMSNTKKFWVNADLSQKQKFQQFIFPQGITCNKDGIVGTPVLSPCYAILGTSVPEKSYLVVPRGFEPLLPG